jgi:nitroreductase
MPMSELGVFEAIHTARALRRLKPDPVPEELITRILDAAIRAPSAGNAQNWTFIVVRDPAQRGKLGDIYRKGSDVAAAFYAARGRPPHLSEDEFRRLMTSGAHLWEHMCDAPVILVPCLTVRELPPHIQALYATELRYQEQIRGSSIYPAVQNIILACRALGLGTTITTNHIRFEDEVRDVLGLPTEVRTFALMPIGFPIGKFGPVTRRPVAEVACADRWSQPWPGGS